jgi:pimeloyl-ACP methyl ester carboxylesterase
MSPSSLAAITELRAKGIEPIAVRASGLEFAALAAGPPSGELVLLLHGFPQTSYSWRRVMPRLAAQGYRVVAPDGRGLQKSARPSEVSAYHVRELVADVLAQAAVLGSERFHLAGHDWGGIVAWHVAGRHPGRVRTLTAVSTPHPRAFERAHSDPSCDQRQRSGYFEVFRTPGAGEDMWLAQGASGLRALYLAAGLEANEIEPYVEAFSERAALTAMLNWYRAGTPTWAEGLGEIHVPTLYAWSDGDPALGREAALSTREWVRAPYRFEIFEGVSHWIPEQAPDRLAALLIAHLSASA